MVAKIVDDVQVRPTIIVIINRTHSQTGSMDLARIQIIGDVGERAVAIILEQAWLRAAFVYASLVKLGDISSRNSGISSSQYVT